MVLNLTIIGRCCKKARSHGPNHWLALLVMEANRRYPSPCFFFWWRAMSTEASKMEAYLDGLAV